MDNYEIDRLFQEAHEDAYQKKIKFEDLPEEKKLHPNYEICGMLLLYSLKKDDYLWSWWATDHTVTMLSLYHLKEPLTKELIQYMSLCGIWYDKEEERFQMIIDG